jgi:hypothetical protein
MRKGVKKGKTKNYCDLAPLYLLKKGKTKNYCVLAPPFLKVDKGVFLKVEILDNISLTILNIYNILL